MNDRLNMSKEVDALVLIGHGHLIAQEPHPLVYEEIDISLQYVRSGKAAWTDDRPITEAEKTSLYAGEVFARLGGLMANRYLQQLPKRQLPPNPFRAVALEAIDEISPFATGEVLRADFAITWSDLRLTEHELPAMFDPALAAEPSITTELQEKWRKAQAVHAQRGTVAIEVYNVDALLEGLSELRISEIAPTDISGSYNIAELADRAAQAELTDVPYYQAFSITEGSNAEHMLASALEDLRLVSNAINVR